MPETEIAKHRLLSISFYDDDDEKKGFKNWVSEAYPFIFFTFVHIAAIIWVLSMMQFYSKTNRSLLDTPL